MCKFVARSAEGERLEAGSAVPIAIEGTDAEGEQHGSAVPIGVKPLGPYFIMVHYGMEQNIY